MGLIHPFENEEEAVSLDGLTIENRTTHISLYGNIALTRDKAGLENARELRDLLQPISPMRSKRIRHCLRKSSPKQPLL